jgi:YidC/Oxa1 family membrane protein insertase
MERRLLLAIVLTFIVLTAYQWLSPTAHPAPPAAASNANAPASQPAAASSTPQPPAATVPAPAPVVEAVKGDTAERTITVENGLVRAVFSNRGAALTAWELPAYAGPGGKPVDLVPHDVPSNQPRPLSFELEDAAKSARVNSALFTTTAGTTLDARTAPVTLSFEYEDAAGLVARKQFRLDPNSYVVTVTATVTDNGRSLNPWIQWGPGLGDVLAAGGGSMFMPVRKAQALYSLGGKVERIPITKLTQAQRHQGSFDFAGVETHYFTSVAVKPGSGEVEFYPLSIPSKTGAEASTRDYVGYDIHFQSMPNGPANARFYVGPKHFETMRRIDTDLVRAIWFGMFAFLCVPLLSALNWLYGFIGNYGWSIIALTVIINAAMFPLRHKSNVSMRKMQAIQPQVKVIQDRYKNLKTTDPARQKMNTELMELYKQKGVNPASGCLPMLLTFPVLFAFYSLLSEAIELRGAPFMAWIHDLAAPDPYYVTPIMVGASQVLQQTMMPMTGTDPVQQKMMLFMPVMFTVMFLTSPSGLAIYWFASNVLIIGQQLLTNKLIGPPDIKGGK